MNVDYDTYYISIILHIYLYNRKMIIMKFIIHKNILFLTNPLCSVSCFSIIVFASGNGQYAQCNSLHSMAEQNRNVYFIFITTKYIARCQNIHHVESHAGGQMGIFEINFCQARVPGPGPLVSDSISMSIIKEKKGPELTL